MTKLSTAQITALRDLSQFGHFQPGTRKATVQVLVKNALVFEHVAFLSGTDSGVYELTDTGREAIGVKVEDDGDFTPENIARAIEDIESTESDEITHILDSDGVLKTSPEGEAVEAPVIPFFNRKALRDLRRNQARANRRMMREQGKRRRKYGADDPKYFRRGYLRMLAETSDTAYDAA